MVASRRAFIIGALGMAASSLTPKAIDVIVAASPEQAFASWYAIWQEEAMIILAEYWSDVMIFGVGAIQHIETYPYVRRVDPLTLYPPTETGELL